MYAGNPKDLGVLIRERRKEKGWSQQDLAESMGATRQWVIAVESGSERAQMGMVLTALRHLDLSVDIYLETSGDELDELLRMNHE